jgi:hypothetical protein|tara:strand:+ start:243 stop:509 length:267 start_codon:yes stop_codon:yes gene_type:complete
MKAEKLIEMKKAIKMLDCSFLALSDALTDYVVEVCEQENSKVKTKKMNQAVKILKAIFEIAKLEDYDIEDFASDVNVELNYFFGKDVL